MASRTHIVGLIVPNLTNPYFADIAGRGEDSTAYLNLTISVMQEYSERGVRGFNFSVWEAMRTAEDFIDAYT